MKLKFNQVGYVWLLLIFGVFYAFVPHTIHHQLNLDFNLEHGVHMILGSVLLIVSFIIWRK